MTKSALVVCLALSFPSIVVPAQDHYPCGIVYGPKAAFKIDASEG